VGTFSGILSGSSAKQDYQLHVYDLINQAGKHENGKRLPNWRRGRRSVTWTNPITICARDVVHVQNLANKKMESYPMHAEWELLDQDGGLVARHRNLATF
jgi:hypothetical protein